MADSYWSGTTVSNQTIYTVPFPYLEQSDVVVEVNSVEQLVPGDFTWLNAGSIKFNTSPPAGLPLSITRQTSPDSALVTFQGGSVSPADLNTANLQTFYRTQEIQDQLNQLLYGGIQSYLGQGAIAGLTPSELIAQVTASVLTGSLATALQAALTDINSNSQSIAGQATQINTLTDMVNSLTNPVLDGLATYLTDETNSRISGDEALASTIALIGAQSPNSGAFILNTSNVYVNSTTSLADSLAGLLANFNSNQAAISSEATVRAAADSANATSITTLASTVSGNTATIATQQTAINGLNAQYTVKVDVNGHVAGFGLATTGTASQFIVDANEFAIIDTGNGLSSPIVPFDVVGGVVYMNNVVISGALIEDATITTGKIANAAITSAQIANAAIGTAQIGDASITGAKIANAAIGTAQIGNLVVTNAQIANLAVGTSNIQDNSISDYDATTAASGTASVGTSTICSLVYSTIGGILLIQAGFSVNTIASAAASTAELVVNGTVYDRCSLVLSSAGNAIPQARPTLFAVVPAGNGSYTIDLNIVAGSTITWSYASLALISFVK